MVVEEGKIGDGEWNGANQEFPPQSTAGSLTGRKLTLYVHPMEIYLGIQYGT